MNVADVIKKIEDIDRDIESIKWAQEQIKVVPEHINIKACDVLGDELKKFMKEKEAVMGLYVEDKPPILGGSNE